MAQHSEQEGKRVTEEDAVIIKPYGRFYCVALSFASYGERAKEARAAYDAYIGSLSLEGGEAVDLIEQLAADFSRITHGLSAPRIREIVTQKQDELNRSAGD